MGGQIVGTIAKDGIESAVGADDEAVDQERSIAASLTATVAKRSDGPVPRASFFVGRAGRCYRSRLVVYVRSDEEKDLGGARRRYTGRRLYQLPRRPDLFLREAPSTSPSDSGSVVELLPVDCATLD